MIYLVCGLNIHNLSFWHGTSGEPTSLLDWGIMQAGIKNTSRIMLDACLHPRKVKEVFREEVRGYKEDGSCDIFISVCTDVIPNVVGGMIAYGELDKDDVKIILLNKDNSSIIGKYNYTAEGMIGDDWPFGFFSWG